MDQIPSWVESSEIEFNDYEVLYGEWHKTDDKTFSKVIAIHYPTLAHAYYVVDELKTDGWTEIKGNHLIEELAHNTARKHAYNNQVPCRVRLVIWDG